MERNLISVAAVFAFVIVKYNYLHISYSIENYFVVNLMKLVVEN